MSYFSDTNNDGNYTGFSRNLHLHHDQEPPANEVVPIQRQLSISESMHILVGTGRKLSDLPSPLSPELKLPQLSPDTTERVFPIRSVVSLDSPASSSAPQSPSAERAASGLGGEYWGCQLTDGKVWSKIPAPLGGANPMCLPEGLDITMQQAGRTENSENEQTVFRRRMSKYGLKLSGITPVGPPSEQGSTGTTSPGDTLNQPTYTQTLLAVSGSRAVQAFGALVVLRELAGKAHVRIVSKNSEEILAYAPRELFRLGSWCDILQEQQRVEFLEHLRHVRDDRYDIEQTGPDILHITIVAPDGTGKDFWCTMHATDEDIICELEPLKNETTKDKAMERDSDGQETAATATLSRFRQSQTQIACTTEAFNSMSRIVQMTAATRSINELVDRTADLVRHLTGFDRVVVHQFDEDWNNVAVAESMDPGVGQDMGSYKGVHFLSSSAFSEQMQGLYSRNRVHFSYSQDSSGVSLAYRTSEDQNVPLDMTYSYLWTASPAVRYPIEMPVHNTMSISITVFGKLWGLIFCQAHDEHTRILPLMRKICWFISDTVSRNLERLTCMSSFQMQSLVSNSTADGTRNTASPYRDILGLFGANYAASSISGETQILGKPSDIQEVLALVEYLRLRQDSTVLWSIDIGRDFPELNYPPGFKFISGLLYIPLPSDDGDFIVFFRNCQWKQVPWAVASSNATQRTVESRPKLAVQKEAMMCRPDGWSETDLENTSILSLVYKSFTEIWQQREAAMQGTQLMKLLLANCAHEFRTPLNAIINYLEIALDASLSQETRENLSRSHSASKSLVYIINDLLDLTNAENGQDLIKDEVFDLSETIREATEIFGEEAKQKYIDLLIVQHSKLPPVLGDQRRVRQVIMNLISNGIQHTSSGAVTVESYILSEQDDKEHIVVEVAIHDTGSGMSQETVEALFCELEQVSNKDYLQSSHLPRSDTASGAESKNILGLGLALVARIVRNMNGQLSVKSEEGKGSCFKIKLRFPLPTDEIHSPSTQESSLPEVISISDAMPGGTDEVKGHVNMCEDTGKPDDTAQPIFQDGQGGFTSTVTADTKRITLDAMPQPDGSGTDESWGRLPAASQTQREDSTEATAERPSSSTQGETKLEVHGQQTKPAREESKPETSTSLHVLVAEDDPINSKILRKRLEKFGHTVYMTGNGKECASVYQKDPGCFDAVLMDIQVSHDASNNEI